MAVKVQVRDRHRRAGVKKRSYSAGRVLAKSAVDECQAAAVGGEDAALSRGNPVRNGVEPIILECAFRDSHGGLARADRGTRGCGAGPGSNRIDVVAGKRATGDGQ